MLIALATLSAACESPQAQARRELQTRLKQEARLTPEELRRWYEQIAPVIAGKTVQVREGAISRTLDNEQRLAVLGVLSDPDAVYDGGLRLEGNAMWRGLKAGATPVLSELDATQTLWIDVETFQPRRYEFEYSSPGFGDYAYDLTLGR
jgi:hypothetical protein